MTFPASPTWFKSANCINKTHLFFPARGYSAINEARLLCLTCPVRTQCFDYSIELAQQFNVDGVWGGATKKEREQYMKQKGLHISRRTTVQVDHHD